MAIIWTWKDAWMLCSAPRWRGADLSHVIGNADAINHDIVSRADLADSFGKLTSAGLVRLEEHIRLTRSGRALVRRAAGRTVHEHLRGVEKELSTLDPPTAWTPWVLSEDAYNAALQRYYQRARRWTRSSNERWPSQ